jgi:hypothetical protein
VWVGGSHLKEHETSFAVVVHKLDAAAARVGRKARVGTAYRLVEAPAKTASLVLST